MARIERLLPLYKGTTKLINYKFETIQFFWPEKKSFQND